MDSPTPSRLENELALLTAMYPDATTHHPASSELKYTSPAGAGGVLHLRLPSDYPDSATLPDVISAVDASKTDLRTRTTAAVHALNLPRGEEVLDAIISAFDGVLEDGGVECSLASSGQDGATGEDADAKKTVVVWLHHLLNTNKRKLALSPPSGVSGLTKPGYPGVLVYSGPAGAVGQHVEALKSQNWQAFQVRYEEGVEWVFEHGKGVREVESMSDVVKGVEGPEGDGKGEGQRVEFLRAVGIK